jgi:hypothetical protein
MALILAAALLVNELLDRLRGNADWSSASWLLAALVWCAVLSASGTRESSPRSDLDDLLMLRGRASGSLALSAPLGRVLLAFGLHAPGCILVGLSRAAEVGVPWAVASTLGLVALSLAGSIALSALAWLSGRLLPEFPSVAYWVVLLGPSLFGAAIVEFQGLVEWWTRCNDVLLRLGAP